MNKLRISQLKQVQQYKSTEADHHARVSQSKKHRLTIPNIAAAAGTKSPLKGSNKSANCKKSLSGHSNSALASNKSQNLRINQALQKQIKMGYSNNSNSNNNQSQSRQMSRDPKREQYPVDLKAHSNLDFNKVKPSDGQCSVTITNKAPKDLGNLFQKPIIKRQKSVGSKNIGQIASSHEDQVSKVYPHATPVNAVNNIQASIQPSQYMYQGLSGNANFQNKKGNHAVTQSIGRISISREGFNHSNQRLSQASGKSHQVGILSPLQKSSNQTKRKIERQHVQSFPSNTLPQHHVSSNSNCFEPIYMEKGKSNTIDKLVTSNQKQTGNVLAHNLTNLGDLPEKVGEPERAADNHEQASKARQIAEAQGLQELQTQGKPYAAPQQTQQSPAKMNQKVDRLESHASPNLGTLQEMQTTQNMQKIRKMSQMKEPIDDAPQQTAQQIQGSNIQLINMQQRNLHTSTEQNQGGQPYQLPNQGAGTANTNISKSSKAFDDSNCYMPMPMRAAVSANPQTQMLLHLQSVTQKSQEQIQDSKNLLELHHEEARHLKKQSFGKLVVHEAKVANNDANALQSPSKEDMNVPEPDKAKGPSRIGSKAGMAANVAIDSHHGSSQAAVSCFNSRAGNAQQHFKFSNTEAQLVKLKQKAKPIIRNERKQHLSQHSFESNLMKLPQPSIGEGSKASKEEKASKGNLMQLKISQASAISSTSPNNPMSKHEQARQQNKVMRQRKNAVILNSIINNHNSGTGAPSDSKCIIMNRLKCHSDQVLLIRNDGEGSILSDDRKPSEHQFSTMGQDLGQDQQLHQIEQFHSHFQQIQNLKQHSRESQHNLGKIRSHQNDEQQYYNEDLQQLDLSLNITGPKKNQDKINSQVKVSSFHGTNTISSKGCVLSEEDNELRASLKQIGLDGTIQSSVGNRQLMMPVFDSHQLQNKIQQQRRSSNKPAAADSQGNKIQPNRNPKKGQVLYGSTLVRKSQGKNPTSGKSQLQQKSSMNDRKSFVMMKTLMLKTNKQDPGLAALAENSHLGKSGKLDAQLHYNREKMKQILHFQAHSNGWINEEMGQQKEPASSERQQAAIPTKKIKMQNRKNEMVVKVDDEQQQDSNQLQLTMMSTEKATCLYSKLVNPEMFYVTENLYKKENKSNNNGATTGIQAVKQKLESSDIDNDFERDSEQDFNNSVDENDRHHDENSLDDIKRKQCYRTVLNGAQQTAKETVPVLRNDEPDAQKKSEEGDMIHIEILPSDSQKLASPKGQSISTSDENHIFKTIDPREIEENIETHRQTQTTQEFNKNTLHSKHASTIDNQNLNIKMNQSKITKFIRDYDKGLKVVNAAVEQSSTSPLYQMPQHHVQQQYGNREKSSEKLSQSGGQILSCQSLKNIEAEIASAPEEPVLETAIHDRKFTNPTQKRSTGYETALKSGVVAAPARTTQATCLQTLQQENGESSTPNRHNMSSSQSAQKQNIQKIPISINKRIIGNNPFQTHVNKRKMQTFIKSANMSYGDVESADALKRGDILEISAVYSKIQESDIRTQPPKGAGSAQHSQCKQYYQINRDKDFKYNISNNCKIIPKQQMNLIKKNLSAQSSQFKMRLGGKGFGMQRPSVKSQSAEAQNNKFMADRQINCRSQHGGSEPNEKRMPAYHHDENEEDDDDHGRHRTVYTEINKPQKRPNNNKLSLPSSVGTKQQTTTGACLKHSDQEFNPRMHQDQQIRDKNLSGDRAATQSKQYFDFESTNLNGMIMVPQRSRDVFESSNSIDTKNHKNVKLNFNQQAQRQRQSELDSKIELLNDHMQKGIVSRSVSQNSLNQNATDFGCSSEYPKKYQHLSGTNSYKNAPRGFDQFNHNVFHNTESQNILFKNQKSNHQQHQQNIDGKQAGRLQKKLEGKPTSQPSLKSKMSAGSSQKTEHASTSNMNTLSNKINLSSNNNNLSTQTPASKQNQIYQKMKQKLNINRRQRGANLQQHNNNLSLENANKELINKIKGGITNAATQLKISTTKGSTDKLKRVEQGPTNCNTPLIVISSQPLVEKARIKKNITADSSKVSSDQKIFEYKDGTGQLQPQMDSQEDIRSSKLNLISKKQKDFGSREKLDRKMRKQITPQVTQQSYGDKMTTPVDHQSMGRHLKSKLPRNSNNYHRYQNSLNSLNPKMTQKKKSSTEDGIGVGGMGSILMTDSSFPSNGMGYCGNNQQPIASNNGDKMSKESENLCLTVQVNLHEEEEPADSQKEDDEPSIYRRLENAAKNCLSEDRKNSYDNGDDEHGTESPPRSVKVINMDDEEEQSFPRYSGDNLKDEELKEVVVVEKEIDNDSNNITDLQRHASNFEDYGAAESIVVKDLKANNSEAQNQENMQVAAQDFTPISILGKGSFGEVYLVEKNGKDFYAMKVLSKEKILGNNYIKYALTERNVLSYTHHPFIVRLNYAFQTKNKLYLILEYCENGDLGSLLKKKGKLDEGIAKIYAAEIILAIQYLHKREIIFRDLKPDNVVIDSEGHCKLTDFGLSKEGIDDNFSANSFCGSLAYLAPEMLARQGHGKSVDWYLLGVLMYEMLVGKTPYYSTNKEQLLDNIENGDLYLPRELSNNAKSIIMHLMDRDPCSRLGASAKDAEAIKEHPFFNDVDWKKVVNKQYELPIPEKRKSELMPFGSDFFSQAKSIFMDLKQKISVDSKTSGMKDDDDGQLYNDKGQGSPSKENASSFLQNKVKGWSFVKQDGSEG